MRGTMNALRSKIRRRILRTSVLLLLTLGAVVLMPDTVPVAHANTITVNSGLDTSGDVTICTLRDAILSANINISYGGCAPGAPGLDTISIPNSHAFCSASICLITLSAPLPAVTGDVSIEGFASWKTVIDGAGAYRVFDLGAVNVTIQNLTVRNGYAPYLGVFPDGGGAIRANGTTLQLTNVNFSGNYGAAGGAIFTSNSTLTLTTVNFSGNTATSGGALYARYTSVVADTSTFDGNRVTVNGGAIMLAGSGMILTNSTLVGNHADGGDGGGIDTSLATDTQLKNVTISGNSAGQGGAIFWNGTGQTLNLNNVTITGNTGRGGGGGIVTANGTVNIRNSIVAANQGLKPDCWATITTGGYNLVGIDDGCTGFTNGVNGDKVGTLAQPLNPDLNPLAYNGGATLTHSLAPNSPALDAGNPGTPGLDPSKCEVTDQRGITRPQGPRCDMGAFEGAMAVIFLPLLSSP